jgi:hypothetical protein
VCRPFSHRTQIWRLGSVFAPGNHPRNSGFRVN